MRPSITAGLLAAHMLAAPVLSAPVLSAPAPAVAAPVVPAAASPLDASLPPVLTDDIIRKAVRETIAEDPHPPAVRGAGAFGASNGYTRMGAAFDQARMPDCLHDDALKHQPATIGPVNVVGPYSLPWVIAAALRGKCH